jgi:hypothetical protein
LRDVLQDIGRPLQDVIIPITRDQETFGSQKRISIRIALCVCVLATVDFDDYPLFEAHEIENEVLKWDLPPKFKGHEAPASKQSPHSRLGVGGIAAHLFCEIADAFGGWPMVWRVRHGPLTRRLTSFGATLSHRGRGKISWI